MRTLLPSIRASTFVSLVAIVLTLLSSTLERNGPELASYGNLCGPSHDQDCLEPVLNAGFPYAYLFDQPGVSVERKLAFIEDKLHPIPFTLNVVAYFFLVSLLVQIATRVHHALERRSARSDA